jgi:hypothetical protein
VTEFVPASRLYDVEAGERVPWDWSKMQPLARSQTVVERAVPEGVGDAGD